MTLWDRTPIISIFQMKKRRPRRLKECPKGHRMGPGIWSSNSRLLSITRLLPTVSTILSTPTEPPSPEHCCPSLGKAFCNGHLSCLSHIHCLSQAWWCSHGEETRDLGSSRVNVHANMGKPPLACEVILFYTESEAALLLLWHSTHSVWGGQWPFFDCPASVSVPK